MKKLLLAAAAALALGGVASAQTMTMPDGAVKDGVIDLTTPEGVMMANRKVQCSTIDEKTDHLLLAWPSLFSPYGRAR